MYWKQSQSEEKNVFEAYLAQLVDHYKKSLFFILQMTDAF
jgi:hypothetical protein